MFRNYHSEPPPKSAEILLMGRGVLNFLLAVYIFFSMIESVESVRDIPRYGDGKFFELKCLAKKMNRKREIGFLN